MSSEVLVIILLVVINNATPKLIDIVTNCWFYLYRNDPGADMGPPGVGEPPEVIEVAS